LASVEASKAKTLAQGGNAYFSLGQNDLFFSIVAYKDLVLQPCAVQEDIEKDVVRSFGNLAFFQENVRRF